MTYYLYYATELVVVSSLKCRDLFPGLGRFSISFLNKSHLTCIHYLWLHFRVTVSEMALLLRAHPGRLFACLFYQRYESTPLRISMVLVCNSHEKNTREMP